MTKILKHILILLTLFVFIQGYAQKFTASVSKNKVAVGEVFQLEFSINTNASNFTPPPFNDFTIQQGPMQSSSVQIINGSMSQIIKLTYYISAKKEGILTIGPATIISGSSTLQSKSITIEATKDNQNTQNQGGQNKGDSKSGKSGTSENIFARTSVSSSKVYTGEQFTITHKVYTRLNLKGFQDIKFPSYNGFWSQDEARKTQYQITNENINGVSYNVVEIKKAFLFAQRSGKIEIEPITIPCIVQEKSGKQNNDPFAQFFGNDAFFGFDSYKNVVYSIKSNSIIVDVLPLPEENKPMGFSGAVGNFSMSTSIDKENAKTNDGINLKINITGRGNLKLIEPPKIEFPDEFESYDPKINENITTGPNGTSGSKSFEYLLIPRHEGNYKIGNWSFTYFDTEKKKYISLPSKEFSLSIEKGINTSNSTPLMSSSVKEDVKILANDIRYINTNPIIFSKKENYFFGSFVFIAGYIIPLLLCLAFILLRKIYLTKNSDTSMIKKRTAGRIAKKQLVQAEKSIAENKKEDFFINVLSALYNYAGNKMSIATSDLSKEKVTEFLKAKNTNEEIIKELVTLIDECEFARYAPGLQSDNLQTVYNRAIHIITKIEDSLS